MGQIKLMSSAVLIGLFTIALITFAINFASDNDAAVSLADDSDYPGIQASIDSDVTQFYDDANVSITAIGKTTISTQTEATEGGSAFKVGPWTTLRFAQQSFSSAYTKIFGSDSGFGIFLTALIAMLSIIMGFYIYKTLAGRNPD